MSDNLRVVATFDLETGEFDAKREEIVLGLTEMEQAAKGAQAGADKLSGATGVLTSKVGTLAKAEGDAAAAAGNLAKEQDAAAKSTTQLGTSVGGLQGILGRVGRGFREFGAGARDGFGTAIKEVGGFRGILSQTGANITSFGKGAVGAFKSVGNFAVNSLKGVGQGVASAASGIPVVGQLAAALGPVGIAAAGAAAGLFKIIGNTDAGATAIQGLGITGGLVFDRITGVAKSFFNALSDESTVIGKIGGFFKDWYTTLFNIATGPLQAILSFTGIGEALKEDFKEGQRIAELFDDVDEAQRKNITTNAKLDAEYKKLNVQLRDRTKTDEERLAIADQLTEIESKRAANELAVLKKNTAAIQAQVDAAKGRNEASDDLDRKLREAQAAEIEASAASVERLEKAENRKNQILDAADQKRSAAAAKRAAEREKAEQIAAQKAEQRQQAEANLNETLEELAAESRNRQLSEAEREVAAVEKKYADLEKVTLEGLQKLREASPPNAQSEIAAREAQVLVEIDKAKAAELAEIERLRQEELAKTREEALESIRQSLLSETELQREAVLQQLDEQVAQAEQFIENEQERNAVIAELTRKAQEELTAIVSDEDAKRKELEEASAAQRQALAEQNANIIAGLAEQGLQTIIAAAAQGEDIQEQAGKQLLALLLDTLEKIILANAFQVQAISAGSPTPDNIATGGLSGIARGVILAAIVRGLFGAAKAAITANYEGDPYVGGDGSRPMWSGRDGYLRRLDKGERVVRTKTNERHYDGLEAMERGRFDEWVNANYILPAIEGLNINDDAKVVRWSQGDMGERMARSIALPRMFDRGIVGAVNSSRKEQAQTNALLEALVHNTRPRRTNSRYN